MIAVRNLSLTQGAFALTGITFEVPAGQYGVLMGRTGCGKTTLLEVICGLKRPASGSVELLGRDVTQLRPAERGVGYVPQDRALFSTMTVYEQLVFALAVRKWGRAAIAERAAELADLLGIDHLLTRRPAGLSGGEAQRVALGRALAMRPGVLLLDEPLSALDEETRAEMYELLQAVKRHTAVTVLHITHSRSEAQHLADRIFVLRDGRVEEVPNVLPDHAAIVSASTNLRT